MEGLSHMQTHHLGMLAGQAVPKDPTVAKEDLVDRTQIAMAHRDHLELQLALILL